MAHTIIPGISWAAALCLGAIVSPPDAVAATAVMSRIGVPRRVITVLEGESLVNDASALVLYRAAVVALVSGTFSLSATVADFVVVAVVGVLVGFAAGWATRWAIRHMPEGYGQIALTLLGPYVAWIAAERLHASAVLACVTGGLYVRQHFSAEVAPMVRLEARSVWELVIFLLNGVIFILIGLQLGPLRRSLAVSSMGQVLRWGVIITLAAIVVRLLWMPIGARLVRLGRRYREKNPLPPARYIFIVGWTGMRGIVSLATALALPLTVADGAPMPYRSELILITFVVILGTLVVQGLTLAPLARLLGLSNEDDSFEKEQRLAREQAAQRRHRAGGQVAQEDWVPPSVATPGACALRAPAPALPPRRGTGSRSAAWSRPTHSAGCGRRRSRRSAARSSRCGTGARSATTSCTTSSASSTSRPCGRASATSPWVPPRRRPDDAPDRDIFAAHGRHLPASS